MNEQLSIRNHSTTLFAHWTSACYAAHMSMGLGQHARASLHIGGLREAGAESSAPEALRCR